MPTPTSHAIPLTLGRTAPSSRLPIPPGVRIGPSPARLAMHIQPRLTTYPAISIFRTPTLKQEPDDARITGGTRSLQRRLLALNLGYIPRPVNSSRPASISRVA